MSNTVGPPYPRLASARKNVENYRNKVHKFENARQVRTSRNMVKPNSQTRPVLDSSSFVPVPTLPHKLVTILLLAFSLFELVAALSQCFCSENQKKTGEVGEYPQYAKIIFNKWNVILTGYVQLRSMIFVVKCVTITLFFACAVLWWKNTILIVYHPLKLYSTGIVLFIAQSSLED